MLSSLLRLVWGLVLDRLLSSSLGQVEDDDGNGLSLTRID